MLKVKLLKRRSSVELFFVLNFRKLAVILAICARRFHSIKKMSLLYFSGKKFDFEEEGGFLIDLDVYLAFLAFAVCLVVKNPEFVQEYIKFEFANEKRT